MPRFFNAIQQATSVAVVIGLLGLAPSVVLAASPSPTTCKKQELSGQLNVNTATAEEWVLLPGIGPATAEKLLAYRQRHAFTRLSQLMRVDGIGKKTFARLQPFLALDGETTLARGAS